MILSFDISYIENRKKQRPDTYWDDISPALVKTENGKYYFDNTNKHWIKAKEKYKNYSSQNSVVNINNIFTKTDDKVFISDILLEELINKYTYSIWEDISKVIVKHDNGGVFISCSSDKWSSISKKYILKGINEAKKDNTVKKECGGCNRKKQEERKKCTGCGRS